jgi:hypothetical protein
LGSLREQLKATGRFGGIGFPGFHPGLFSRPPSGRHGLKRYELTIHLLAEGDL